MRAISAFRISLGILSVVCFGIVLMPSVSCAMDADTRLEAISSELERTETILVEKLEEIERGFMDTVEKCRDSYAESLVLAEEKATQSGDLEGVLKIREARASFSKDRAVDEVVSADAHAAVKAAVAAYFQNLQKADLVMNNQKLIFKKKYMKYLEDYKIKLTQERRIEEAVVVADKIKKLSSDTVISGAVAVAESSPAKGNCVVCDGSGRITLACKKCGPDGRCRHCDGTGIEQVRGGNGKVCQFCKGTRQCPACNGTKKAFSRCAACGGGSGLVSAN